MIDLINNHDTSRLAAADRSLGPHGVATSLAQAGQLATPDRLEIAAGGAHRLLKNNRPEPTGRPEPD